MTQPPDQRTTTTTAEVQCDDARLAEIRCLNTNGTVLSRQTFRNHVTWLLAVVKRGDTERRRLRMLLTKTIEELEQAESALAARMADLERLREQVVRMTALIEPLIGVVPWVPVYE